jgi:hypothetical protein
LTGASFWVEPREDLAVVVMTYAPGLFAEYHRKVNALVLDAVMN